MSEEVSSANIATLLAETPPNRWVDLVDSVDQIDIRYKLKRPVVELWCQSEACSDYMLHECKDATYLRSNEVNMEFVVYTCKHCGNQSHRFALVLVEAQDGTWAAIKLGQNPPFGPPLPAEVITLLGSERHHFLQGWRSENQGFGIGAFAYYRRVIEAKRDAMIDEIIKVAERLQAPQDAVNHLKAARTERQFDRAVEKVQLGLPDVLRLPGGHNPLKLLHSALSEGLHAESDEACLESATTIRLVLVEFAHRVKVAMTQRKELEVAVSRLLAPKSPKGTPTARQGG